ncbi:MAG: hypothetical protein ACLS6O_02400 [Bifidobacterium sp.]
MKRIKPWYEPREDDVILTASFDITVGEAPQAWRATFGLVHYRRQHVERKPSTSTPTSPNDSRTHGDNVRVDEFYTDSRSTSP